MNDNDDLLLVVSWNRLNWNISQQWCVNIQSAQIEELIHIKYVCMDTFICIYTHPNTGSRHTLLLTFWEISRICRSIQIDIYGACLFHECVCVCVWFLCLLIDFIFFLFFLQLASKRWHSIVKYIYIWMRNQNGGIIFDRWHDEILAENLNIFE